MQDIDGATFLLAVRTDCALVAEHSLQERLRSLNKTIRGARDPCTYALTAPSPD